MKLLAIGLLTLVFTSCFFDGEEKQAGIKVEEVDVTPFEALGDTVTLSTAVASLKGRLAKKTTSNDSLVVIRKAQMKPVNVNGVFVQASNVVVSGNTAYVAYNTSGNEYRGALQVIENFGADSTAKKPPTVVQEFHITGLEINTLFVDGGLLYFGGAGDPAIFKGRSILGSLKMSSLQVEDFSNDLKTFHSYGVVSIQKLNNEFLLGLGAKDGGVLVLNAALDSLAFHARPDIRSLVVDGNEYWALAGTTDAPEHDQGGVLVGSSANNYTASETFIAGFSSNYHRAEMVLFEGKYLLCALAEAGFKAYEQSDLSKPLWEQVNQEVEDLLVSANGIGATGNLVLLASGELGVRVVKQTSGFDVIEDLGLISFQGMQDENGQNYSANSVTVDGNRVLIAAGAGGLQLYDIQ